MNPLVLIAGPTGSGKSSLALRLARRFRGEIINCDSVQIYRGFDIGSAKLPPAERDGIPHHLIDIADPTDVFTAGDFARQARIAIHDITARRALPILAGGTGFYVSALIDGLFEGPPRDEAIRERLSARESRKPGGLHRILTRLDRQSAAKIHRNDVNKTIRALEVIVTSRQPLSQLYATRHRDSLVGYEVARIGLDPPRAALYERVDARVAEMFDAGLVSEVRGLLAAGWPPSAKPFESLGYAQALRHVQGTIGLAEAIAETRMMTRRYAKRQWTWFRRDRDMEWLAGFGNDPAVIDRATNKISRFLERFGELSV